MAQLGPFGEPGGAGGVLDLGDVVRVHLGQHRPGPRGGQEIRPLGEQDDLPQRGTAGAPPPGTRPSGCGTRNQEDAGRAGLTQHVGQLSRARRRVTVTRTRPGQGGPVLQDNPLGQFGARPAARSPRADGRSAPGPPARPRRAVRVGPPPAITRSGGRPPLPPVGAVAAAVHDPATVVSSTGSDVSAGQHGVATMVRRPHISDGFHPG